MRSHRQSWASLFNLVRFGGRPAPSRRKKAKPALRFEALERREVFSAGGLDPTFNFGFGKTATDFDNSSDWTGDMAFQADGKIVMAGSTNAGGGNSNFALARYNADGTLDGTFGGMGGIGAGRVATDFTFGQDYGRKVAILPDGKILVAGTSQPTDGSSLYRTWAFARYNADGTLDNSFGTLGRAVAEGMADENNDSLIGLYVMGDKFLVVSSGYVPTMARFNLSDGSVDETFGVGGRIVLNVPIAVVSSTLHEDGLVLGGWHNTTDEHDMAVVRVNMDGTLDANFGNQGVSIISPSWKSGYINSLTVQDDGAIVGVGTGRTNTDKFLVVTRLLADGTIDSSFNVDGVYQHSVPLGYQGLLNDVTVAPGGAIVAAGMYGPSGPSNWDFAAIRLGPDGAPDEAFGPDGLVTIDFAGARDEATNVLSYANGKILLGGKTVIPDVPGYDFGLTRLFGVNTGVLDPGVGDLLDPGRDDGGLFSKSGGLVSAEDSGDDQQLVGDYRVKSGDEDSRDATPVTRTTTAVHDAALLSLLADDDGDPDPEALCGAFGLSIKF